MALNLIAIPPGIHADDPPQTAGPRWINCDKVRFRLKQPQKIGGWQKLTPTSFTGEANCLFSWRELDADRDLALGTVSHLYIVKNSTLYDVTPAREVQNPLGNNPFNTTSGNTTITVTDTAHGADTGARVTFSGAATFNGVTISGTYTLTKVDSNTYTISHSVAPSGSGTGGGAAVIGTYSINPYLSTVVFASGYNVGAYGASTYGTARTSTTTTLTYRPWSFDSWGEDLIAARREGPIYLWDSSAGTSTAATEITQGPDQVGIALVSDERHLIALGAHDGSAYNSLLVAWSDQEDYTTWTPGATNAAGDYLLTSGNRIISAEKTKGQVLIWTDTTLYSMQYLGPPYIYGFQPIGKNCGSIAQNGTAAMGGVAFWMGPGNFFTYDGTVRTLECPVKSLVYDNLDPVQQEKVYATILREFNEVWWFYPSMGSTTNDSYVIYNFADGTWAVGTMTRTAMIDKDIFPYPVATGTDNYIYWHEIGSNADADPLSAYIESGTFQMGNGDRMMFTDGLIPDFTATGNLSLTLYTRRYPFSADIAKGPYTLTPSTESISFRGRGRQFRFRVDSADINNAWRLGLMRFNAQPDGRR